jgi:hypothetical protein
MTLDLDATRRRLYATLRSEPFAATDAERAHLLRGAILDTIVEIDAVLTPAADYTAPRRASGPGSGRGRAKPKAAGAA